VPPRNLHFRRKVFVFYSFLVSGILILLCSFFFIFIFNILRGKAEEYFKQVLEKVSSNLDNVVLTLDVVSTQLVASSDLQDAFTKAGEWQNAPENYFDKKLPERKKAMDILIAINSAKDRVKRLSIFNRSGTFVSLGSELEDTERVRQNITQDRWYTGTDTRGTFYKLLPPHLDDWVKGGDATTVFSLVRPFVATYSSYATLGTIEVQQSYSMLADICRLDDPRGSLKLLVVDKDLNVIYPYGSMTSAQARVYSESAKRASPGQIYPFHNTLSGVSEYACFMKTMSSPWTVILSQARRDFLGPAYSILIFLFLICVVVILASLLAIFLVTRSLMIPLQELRESVKSITLEDPPINLSSSHNEIELLKDAFNDMLRRLKDSTHQIIQAKASEGHAHFLALQAEINPHFLYNSIMSISAAGQEAGSRKVQIMCAQLSDIFRYIASSNGAKTTMKDELHHAETYLKFIKWRYEELLDFSIDIPDALQGVRVGKLFLQPIIENCFSHGFDKVRPPYRVRVIGSLHGDRWRVEISDNGRGFSESVRENLTRQFAQIDENIRAGKLFNEREVGGMALINISTRLKLLYKEKAEFRIDTLPEGGARVTVGGGLLS
jgi:two-component system, sensor histidine kinase YesM